MIGVPILEVWGLVKVGQVIGAWPMVLVLLVGAVVGGWLARHEGSRAWTALQRALGTGRMPSRELADGALVMAGGLLLMLPGFFTDLVGLVCLLPFTRPLARRVLAALVGRRVRRFTEEVELTRVRLDPGHTIRGESDPAYRPNPANQHGADRDVPGPDMDDPGHRDGRPGSGPRVIRGEVE